MQPNKRDTQIPPWQEEEECILVGVCIDKWWKFSLSTEDMTLYNTLGKHVHMRGRAAWRALSP